MQNYNPYAAPQAPPQPAPMMSAAGGPPQDWEIGEVLTAAWEAFKGNWAPLVLSLVVFFVAIMVPYGVVFIGASIGDTVGAIVSGLGTLLTLGVLLFLMPGMVKLQLAIARGEPASVGIIFSGGNLILSFLIAGIIFFLAYTIGLILLVVPGIIVIMGLWPTFFFIADGMGPIDALKRSWQVTTGYKGRIFLFFLVAFVLQFIGSILCYVPGLIVSMVTNVALAMIYLRLTGMAVGAPPQAGFAPAGAYGAPPPQGGYGPPGGGGYGAPPGAGGYGPPGGAAPGGGYAPAGGGGYGPPGGGQPGGYGPPGGQPPQGQPGGYGPPGGQPGYGPPGGQPPQGQPAYGPPGGQPPQGQPAYGPPGGQPPQGQPGYGPPQGQPGYGPPGGQPGYNPGGQPPQGQPGYGPPGGQPGYNPGGQPPQGQPGYGPPGGQPPPGGYGPPGGGGYNPGGGGQPPPGGGYPPR